MADALSRHAESSVAQTFGFSSPEFLFLYQLIQENKSDPELISSHKLVYAEPLTYPEYQIRDGLLLKNRKLLISSSSHLRNSIIQEFHSTAIAEHGGIQKIDKTASNSYWPG